MTTKIHYRLPNLEDEGGEFSGNLSKIAADLIDPIIGLSPADGASFAAEEVTIEWVPCHCTTYGYVIPDHLPGELRAVAFGDGLGWHADMLCGDTTEAAEILHDMGDEDTEYLACEISSVAGTITFRANPPRCEWSASE